MESVLNVPYTVPHCNPNLLPYMVNNDESESTDEEQNSCGSSDSDEYVFDIHSQESTASPCSPLVTYKQLQCEDTEYIPNIQNVHDCCEYSNAILFLKTDGKIICSEYSKQRVVESNRFLIMIFTYHGELIGVDKKGTAYVLTHHYHDADYWKWKKCQWMPINIVHASTSLDGQYMFIETNTSGYMYKDTETYKEVNKETRILGKDSKCYLVLDHCTKSCDIFVNNENIRTQKHVYDAVMDENHKVYSIHTNDQHLYKGIRWIRDKPYYIHN